MNPNHNQQKKQSVLTKFFNKVKSGPQPQTQTATVCSTGVNVSTLPTEQIQQLVDVNSVDVAVSDGSGGSSRIPFDISHNKDAKPCQPILSSYPSTITGKTSRRFSKHCFEKYPMLEYSIQQDKVYCFSCRHFPSTTGTSFTTGYSDWKHMNKLFEKHFLSNNSSHQLSYQKYLMYQQSKQTGSITTQLDHQHKANVIRNRDVLSASVEVVLLCAKQEIALRAHSHCDEGNDGNFAAILELLKRKSPNLEKQISQMPANATYTSHRIQNEILSVSGKLIRRMIMEEVKNTSKCYSIICDESRDSSSKEQLSFCIRYVSDLSVKERFVAYSRLQQFDAESIVVAIVETLKSTGLIPARCVSQAYDGASVMSGVKNGVQKKFESKVGGKCPYVHCYAHRLNLVLVDCCNSIRDVNETLGLVQAVYNFQSNSVIRGEIFQQAQCILNYSTILKMPQSCSRRWSSKHKGIQYFKNRFDSTLSALDYIVENGKSVEAAECRGYVAQFRTFKTNFIICCLDEVLSTINQLTEYLQCPELLITRAVVLCKATIETLVKMRTVSKFLEIWNNAETIANKSEVSTPGDSTDAKHSRRKVPSSQLKDFLVTTTLGSRESEVRTMKDKLRVIFFEIVDTFAQEMNRRFLHISEIGPGISAANPQSDNFMKAEDIILFCKEFERFDFDIHAIKSEIPVALNLIKAEKLDTIISCYCYVFKMAPSFKQLTKYFQIVLSIPVSTATAGRSFSAMKRIKTPLRSSSGDERTSDLAHISTESDLSDKLYLNTQIVVDEFATLTKRRVEFCL